MNEPTFLVLLVLGTLILGAPFEAKTRAQLFGCVLLVIAAIHLRTVR